MGARFLVDANVGIDFLNNKLPVASTAWLEWQLQRQQLALSVVVRIELLSWVGTPADVQLLEDFIAATPVLPLDEPVVLQTIRLRQQHRVKLPGAIIAATALVHGLPLLSRNTNDCRAVTGLTLPEPGEPGGLPA